MPFLWNIAVHANNEVVAGQAISMLNDLYQNLGPSLQDRVREKREEYVKHCMQHMLQVRIQVGYVDSACTDQYMCAQSDAGC